MLISSIGMGNVLALCMSHVGATLISNSHACPTASTVYTRIIPLQRRNQAFSPALSTSSCSRHSICSSSARRSGAT